MKVLAPMGFDLMWIDWEYTSCNVETMNRVCRARRNALLDRKGDKLADGLRGEKKNSWYRLACL